MGIPRDEIVQDGSAAGYGVAEEATTMTEKANASTHSLDPQKVQSLSESIPLEDVLAFADAQYYNNEMIPQGDKVSPHHAILASPLKYVWGPATPAMNALPASSKIGESNAEDLEDSVAKDLHSRRMLRKVTALGAFYLITTDILGPFNSGYVFSQVGYVPGALCYVFLGIAAWYAGNLLSVLYMRVDSDTYPVNSYGGIVLRVMGPYARILTDALMIVQLVVNCGTIILSNAQSMEQVIQGAGSNLCFVVAIVVFLIVQLILSPIRSLKGVGFFANAAVFLNVALIFITIGFITTSPPNYAAALASFGVPEGPVVTSAFVSQPLESRVNGIMNMVFAYGGAMIFVDFLSEMKRPWDFWKSMSFAQLLIMSMYMMFGIVTYSQQGQFTESLAYYGVSPYAQQTVGNVIAVITGLIAALLYGNIAQKLCYNTIVIRWFGGPALMTSRGWIFWMMVNLVFWPVAFIVGAAIPQIQTISGLIAAVCILQFSYSFPFLLKVALDLQIIAMRSDPTHTVGSAPQRRDSWSSPSRWSRAVFGDATTKERLVTLGHVILFLASLSMACLGMYGSGAAIKTTFETGAATSFGCTAPA